MNDLLQLSIKEKDALRLYEGDIRIRDTRSNKVIEQTSKDSIWGDRKAYKTLNALMFEGTENEEIRIVKEESKLNPSFIIHIQETIEILSNIYRAMCKYGKLQIKDVEAYRVERNSSIKDLTKGQTISCFSASKVGFKREFANKSEIILIELIVRAGIPFVDYNKVLKDEYYLSEEEEILLPPFVPIQIEELGLSMRELKIKDKHGKKPKGKYRVITEKREVQGPLYEQEKKEKEALYKFITSREMLDSAKLYIEDMNQKGKGSEENKIKYSMWKNNYQKYMKYIFREIEWSILD